MYPKYSKLLDKASPELEDGLTHLGKENTFDLCACDATKVTSASESAFDAICAVWLLPTWEKSVYALNTLSILSCTLHVSYDYNKLVFFLKTSTKENFAFQYFVFWTCIFLSPTEAIKWYCTKMPLSHTSDFEMTVPYGAIRGKVWSNLNLSRDDAQEIVRIIGKLCWFF